MLNQEYNIFSKTVTYEDSQEDRKMIFKEFQEGIVQSLCAMGVLDEGLDIPSTKYAFFLSSSGNPKQFIQRRGRVLRKEKNIDKTAMIYDFIALPNGNIDSEFDIMASALKRELTRFIEFASLAENKLEARDKIWSIALKFGFVV